MKRRLYVDIETRSRLDLRETGVYPYAEASEILCHVYWFEGSFKVHIPLAHMREKLKSKMVVGTSEMMADYQSADEIIAHNANFERTMLNAHGVTSEIPIEKWKCTQAKSAYHGLPHSLEKSSEALELEMAKDMGGRAVMLAMCKPKKKKDGTEEWIEDRERFLSLVKYCITDVKVTKLLDETLDDLPEKERRIWCLDQRINDNGFPVNAPLAKKIVDWVEQEDEELIKEAVSITDGFINSPRQVNDTRRWLAMNGLELENLQASNVDRILETEIPENCRRVLEIRRTLSKSSTSKHKRFLSMQRNGFVSGTLQYYGAGTGRWAGRGVQPQNFPRNCFDDTELEHLEACESKEDAIMVFGGTVFEIASRAVRGMISAPEGFKICATDYSSIESRVLGWLAGDDRIIDMYEKGTDIYKKNAESIFSKEYSEISKFERQIGKVAELALGYQGYTGAFAQMASSYGVKLTSGKDGEMFLENGKSVKDVVVAWRNSRPLVTRLWAQYERGALRAVRETVTVSVGKIDFKKEILGNHHCLTIRLPSGRKLFYPRIGITSKEHFGKIKSTLCYFKYEQGKFAETLTYGGQLVENVVQAIARDLMAEAMLKAWKEHRMIPSLTVHDEVVGLFKDEKQVRKLEECMETLPEWGGYCGLKIPLKVETSLSRAYGK